MDKKIQLWKLARLSFESFKIFDIPSRFKFNSVLFETVE